MPVRGVGTFRKRVTPSNVREAERRMQAAFGKAPKKAMTASVKARIAAAKAAKKATAAAKKAETSAKKAVAASRKASKRTSTGASKMAKAKKKVTKASRKRRAVAGVKKYWADVKAGRVKRKGYKPGTAKKAKKTAAKRGPAKRKPSKVAKKSGSTKKKMSASRRAKIGAGIQKKYRSLSTGAKWGRGKIKHRSGTTKKTRKTRKAKKSTGTKTRTRKTTKTKRRVLSVSDIMRTNRRRRGRKARKSYRRNAGTMPTGSLTRKMTALVTPVLTGAGGYAVHRVGTQLVAKLLESFLPAGFARVIGAVLVAAGGVYATHKFLPKYSFNASLGMGLSTFGIAVKEFVPSFADYTGFSGVPSQSLLPRYSLGEYFQAAAGRDPFLQASAGGDPFLQGAAGEYYSTPQLGEYFSQDMFAVSGAEGQFAMSKIDVQGDTGAYEFNEQFSGSGAGNVDEGLSPNSNMDAAFNFMEAAAGVGPADRSTYIPHERALPAGQRSTNTESGIFDTAGIFG
jgi:histone H1/5